MFRDDVFKGFSEQVLTIILKGLRVTVWYLKAWCNECIF